MYVWGGGGEVLEFVISFTMESRWMVTGERNN